MPKNYTKEELENGRWVTMKGTRVFIKDGETPQEAIDRALGKSKKSVLSKGQLDYEEKIRNSTSEKGAYFDANGNLLMEAEGDTEQVTFGGMDDWDNQVKFNREVEQRIWNDEEVHFTHNHPEDTIFSPEDLETFETLEAKSISAILRNGTAYRLFREQPRSSNEYVLDVKTGEFKLKFEPKKIAEEYNKAYSNIYDEGYARYKKETVYGTPERAKAIVDLDNKVAREMEKWLLENAPKYGYRFEMEIGKKPQGTVTQVNPNKRVIRRNNNG